MPSRPTQLFTAAAVAALLAACSTTTPAPTATQGTAAAAGSTTVTIYSGRSEKLVKPLLDRIAGKTGTKVEVRYGDSSELAAQLLEEGTRTQADLFFSQDAGALGALALEDRLEPLPQTITSLVQPGYADAQSRWVATSARARVVAYDPRQAPEVEQMTSIDAVLDPKYRGKIGFAPTNASFHAFVTALRVAKGDAAAKDWLQRFKANEPKAFGNNNAVLDAVNAGQTSIGLINHYYWHAQVAAKGAANVPSRIRFLGTDDPGALVNVAGIAVLKGSAERTQATQIVAELLSQDSQQYFADETAEYPVVAGVTSTKHQLPPLTQLSGAKIDLNKLDSLKQTLAMLQEVGLT